MRDEKGTNETASSFLKWGIDFLESSRVPEARISAEELLSHVLKRPRFLLYLDPWTKLNEAQEEQYELLLRERAGRCPLQYLLGNVPFRNAVLEVGEGCLIPRPETEVLVEIVLQELDLEFACCVTPSPLSSPPGRGRGKGEGDVHLLDVGTGSGNIAISLAQERPDWLITATDISGCSLQYARENADRNGVRDRIHFVETDLWLGAEAPLFDAVISNPPYLTSQDLENLQPEIHFEPRAALDGGVDGLDFFRRIASRAREVLKPGGYVFFEMGLGQASSVSEILEANEFGSVKMFKDDTGINRFVSAVKAAV